MIPLAIAILAIAALTELQVDHIIRMVEEGFKAISAGIQALWIALSPIGIGYLMYKQAKNRKALDANTEVSQKAFDTANGHNEKIARAVEISEKALTKLAAEPQKVEVVNTQEHPVPTTTDTP